MIVGVMVWLTHYPIKTKSLLHIDNVFRFWHKGKHKMTKAQAQAQAKQNDKNNAINRLHELGVTQGSMVYGKVVHVSRSGMSRHISFFVAVSGEIVNISYYVATVLDWRLRDGAVVVEGYGMDMIFHTVYNLSYCLWPKGYQCCGDNCNSNDHHNPLYSAKDGKMWHNDGGYALRAQSL